MKNDYDASLLDAVADNLTPDQTIDKVASFDPDLLVLDTTTPTIHNDIKFIEGLKERNPAIKVLVVGTHVSALPNETLKQSDKIDFVARGEYDYTILELVKKLEKNEKLSEIRGISRIENGGVIHHRDREFITNLDELPFVSQVYKKFLNYHKYRYALAKHPMIQIMSSRGCPNRCTFCQWPQVFMGHKFRIRSPKNFVSELEYIDAEMPDVREIFIEDDTFTTSEKRVFDITDMIGRNKLDIEWSVNVRADLSYEVMKSMKNAGCRLLVVGYENGSQEILDNIKKGTNLVDAVRFTKNARKAGLRIFGCFMVGLPGETKETIEMTFKFAKKLNPDMAFFQQAVPFPGTEFYTYCKENNYLVTDDFSEWLSPDGRLNYLVSYPTLSNKDIEAAVKRMMRGFYLTPRYMSRLMKQCSNMEETRRILNAGKEYIKYEIRGE